MKKKNLVVLGLNAGTSGDGLDMAVVKINLSANRPVMRFLAGKTVRYSATLKGSVDNAIHNKINSLDELIKLDRQLGMFYGKETDKFCKFLKRKRIKIDLIASHGQTVRHLPGKIEIDRKAESGTIQLGHPETIAQACGLLTVADFRQSDIAAGGEGAPITAFAMWHLFGSGEESRMLLNIGGIANFFLFPKNGSPEEVLAADCGPGNSLIDILANKFFRMQYDRGGRAAAEGKISVRLLTILLADNFLKGKYGPSTGRERFGEKFSEKIIKYGRKLRLSKKDMLATTTELTAVGIANSVEQVLHKFGIDNIYLFGGGVSNKFLIKRLQENLPGINFFSVDRLNYNPDYLEAVCYAVMGAKTVNGLTSTLAHITGAAKNCIAGRIIQPV